MEIDTKIQKEYYHLLESVKDYFHYCQNIGITARFNPSDVRSCSIGLNEENNTVYLLIQGNQITYKPGDKATISYLLHILDDVRSIVY